MAEEHLQKSADQAREETFDIRTVYQENNIPPWRLVVLSITYKTLEPDR